MTEKYEEKAGHQVTEEYYTEVQVEDDTHVDVEGVLQKGTKRDLQARHIQMIAIGGTIGTGLFLRSGQAIAQAGPAGAFLAYVIIGIMVFCVMTGLGEVATYMPTSGSFTHYATRFVDPAFGFAVGWNYWFSWAITIATELSAAASIIQYWDANFPAGALCAIFLVFLFFLNVFGVRGYGEAEYWFSLLKVITVILFIIVCVLVDSGAIGGTVYGTKLWANPFPNGFGGFLQTLLGVAFAYQGTELVGITAGESRNPRRNVPRAINNVFWRILLFYCVSIFFEGCILNADDPRLTGTDAGTVAVAPFTLIFQNAFGKGAASFINVVILTSVLSAGNSGMYASSRTIMALARENKAPRIFGITTKYGIPFWSICLSTAMGLLSFLTINNNDTAVTVFNWLANITGTSGFISWMSISISHFYFRRAYLAQGRDVRNLPYRSIGYPFTDLFAAGLIILIVFFQGYSSIVPFDYIGFLTNYIGIVPFVVAIVGYKVYTRCKSVKPLEADLDTGRREHFEEEMEDAERDADKRWYMKIYNFVA